MRPYPWPMNRWQRSVNLLAESLVRFVRIIRGVCQHCGYESHHSTTGVCDFRFRSQAPTLPATAEGEEPKA